MSPPINLIAFIIAAAAIWLPPLAAAIPAPGLDAFLSDQSRHDPYASNDSFLLLPASLKSSLAAAHPPSGHRALTSSVLSLKISVPVYVKLVGAAFSSAAPQHLISFATAALSSDVFSSISSLPSHTLALSHSLHLEPSLSTLAPRLSSAITTHISSSPAPLHRSAHSPVPFSVVNDIVAEDFRQQSASSPPGFYIYILNLGPQGRSYAYSSDNSGDSSSPAFTKCMGSVWAGKERYLWIDLAAGPVDYGPSQSGEGLLPQSELHPLAALHNRPKSEKSLLADLASLVLSAYRTLLVPSLRVPAYFESSLIVQLIHLRASDKQDSHGLDWALIEKTIKDGNLVFGDQELVFRRYTTKLMDCPICSFAVAKSMNSYTSRFLFENFTMIVSEYLDSKRLHKILSDSSEDVRREIGVPEEESGRVLPVYVFDLDYDRNLALDRFHQAVAFRNMVIAVRTRASQSVSDYSCNGRHVIIQTRNLERPIVGSVLQSMWGVSPTHLSWSPKHNSTLVDYTWSVGQTPFGPFTESLPLSFAQKDAAKRNVLLTSLNATITSAIDVLDSLGSHGGDRKILKKNRHVQFVQRWNLFKYKLDKVVSAMSHLDYEKAMYFLRSSDHDLFAIHNLVYSATQELEASLVCFKDPPFPWGSISMAAVFLSVFFYIYAKRDKIFRSKRKQF